MICDTHELKRILAIEPSSKGFGYVVIESPNRLADWGLKEARENKNAKCVRQVAELLKLYEPDVVALENITQRGSNRADRVKSLIREIGQLCEKHKVKVREVSKSNLRHSFKDSGDTSKAGIAKSLARRFPDLAVRLPRPRKSWEGPNPRMALFGAMAMAVVAMEDCEKFDA